MYGVINKSLREMVLGQFGEAAWQRVLTRSGVGEDSFLSMQSYDDAITYQLAQACAEELGIDLADALKAFGVHWIEHTLAKDYNSLANTCGDDLVTFLSNLNALHDRISSTFLDYQPPGFSVERMPDGHVHIVYTSTRVGLTPFVEGLLEGLAGRFNQPMEIVEQQPLAVEEGEQTAFTLRML